MLHTVIETTLFPHEKSIKGLTRILNKAVKKAWKRTKNYFQLIQKTQNNDERLILRRSAEEDSRRIILDIVNNSRLCKVCSISTENAWKPRWWQSFTLVIDALDGMNNFKLGIPNFSVSAAILKWNEILFWVVYHPMLNSLYTAYKNQWAFKNGIAIHVNDIEDIEQATVSYIHEHRRIPASIRCSIFGELVDQKIKRFMMDWSPSNNFCLLAEWKIEGVMCNQESLYDFCAGKIIAHEAGWLLSYMDPLKQVDTNDTFVISNRSTLLNKKLTQIFKKYV